jgi:hypothetical protein
MSTVRYELGFYIPEDGILQYSVLFSEGWGSFFPMQRDDGYLSRAKTEIGISETTYNSISSFACNVEFLLNIREDINILYFLQ